MGKVVSRDELKEIVQQEKAAGKKIVFTNGCFDLIHLGHIRYLREAEKQGDLLIVAVNSDQSVKELKGENRPLVPEEARAEIISALASVDFVVIFPEETPAEIITLLKPDVLVKGGDWKPEEVVGKRAVEQAGGKVVIIPFLPHHSSTDIIRRILCLSAKVNSRKK